MQEEDWQRIRNGLTFKVWLSDRELAELGPWPFVITIIVGVAILVAIYIWR